MGGILGASQGDYNNLAGGVYQPNTGRYVNTADPGALSTLGNVAGQQQAVANAGYGNQGLAAQQQALSQTQQMAQGNGPSLARANMNAGLNTTFTDLGNQAMSNQGNVGAGNSQRNLLNAEANAANNVTQQAGVASVAEQMGALQQQNAAAQGLTTGELNQGNFQNQTLQGLSNTATAQSNIGQQDTNNAMALDSAQQAAQAQKQAYQLQGDQATANEFKTGLGYVGQLANIGGAIAGTVASGGASQLMGAATSAIQNGVPPGQLMQTVPGMPGTAGYQTMIQPRIGA